MSAFFSQSTKLIYFAADVEQLPEDAVAISNRDAVIGSQLIAAGLELDVDDQGRPEVNGIIEFSPADVEAIERLIDASNGVEILSDTHPEIAGVYDVKTISTRNFSAIAAYVEIHGEFPGGDESVTVRQADGTPVKIHDVGVFNALFSAIRTARTAARTRPIEEIGQPLQSITVNYTSE